MKTRDITESFERLDSLMPAVERGIDLAVENACVNSPPLFTAVQRLLQTDGSGSTRYRLFPLALHAAMTGDPSPALPLAVISRIWWTGAETLDDIMDGEFDSALTGLGHGQAMIAAVTCTTLVPHIVIAEAAVAPAVATVLAAEFVATSLACASGQIDDLDMGGHASWARTMRSYVGKTGAPYERDAVMAAHLAGQDKERVRGWRAFGRLFGVLRQLSNDHAEGVVIDDADMSNGVRTLFYAHAVEAGIVGGAGSSNLLRLSMIPPALLKTYLRRVESIAGQLYMLLDQLVHPSEHRDIVRWLIQTSLEQVRSADVFSHIDTTREGLE
ncbi:hypothetical protein ABZX92_27740 [Lentzea sp. NPDC006480]|uniref:hypothetical protein n=1 Tax=Lentzea sp. NPDC006480 TaxID=3157176 RepID=UPI0033BE8C29